VSTSLCLVGLLAVVLCCWKRGCVGISSEDGLHGFWIWGQDYGVCKVGVRCVGDTVWIERRW